MSNFQSTGLYIRAADPLLKTNRSNRLFDLHNVSEYIQESRLIGGFYSATIGFVDKIETINDWIQSGIGRDIQVFNPAHQLTWQGFVNQIDVAFGENTYSIGPLTDIGNSVAVIYSTVDTSTDPPTIGERTVTAYADNTVSQALYGTWEKIRAISGATSTEAEQLRDTYINDPNAAFPYVSNKLTTTAGDLSVSLKCLGYWHYLTAFYYTLTGVTGDVDLDEKITDVLASHSIFSTDYSKITANTLQVADAYEQEQFGETLIKKLISLGDASDNPYSGGFYGNQVFTYETIPTTIEYEKRQGKEITNRLGGVIRPWDVRPAKWLFQPDLLVGRHPPITSETLGTDPRAMLIDVVKYTAPYELNLIGTRFSQLDQMLAKFGLNVS